MRKHLILLLLMSLKLMTYGQTLPDIDVSELLPPPIQAQALHYWFDGDSKNTITVDGLTGTYSLDVSALSDGIHTLYYQVKGEDGMNYGIAAQVFLKMSELEMPSLDEGVAASTIQYWFDGNTDIIETVNGQTDVYFLDVSSLPEGMHSFYCQIIGVDGQRYGLASQVFLKMADIEAPTIDEGVAASNLQYWFDTDSENVQTANGLTGVYALDISSLEDGMHTLHYQVMGVDGQRYGLASQMFLKMPEIDTPELSSSVAASELRYWIDDDTENMQIVKGLSGAYVLDMSTLVDGVHTLHYQIMGEDGQRYGLTSQVFVKMTDTFEEMANITKDSVLGRVDENGITQYKYWLNENAATMQTVKLDEMSSPFTLLTLLPIKGDSIRSSNFLFETKSGKPMLYAKNDFHIRFIDAAGYWVDAGKPFIDYGTSREVIPEQVLEGFTCNVSMQKPAFNEIRWYAFEAAPGDTTAFKLSQPATIQVFAPSGEEIFKSSEYESTKWSGIHTWEEGTYYLAVHDVTGSQSAMSLDYMHMDKYDVVDWDVHRVGNGGCSTITFKGNGFRDLYAVDLVIAPDDTIHSVAVSHESDAETSVTFDFTDATLGVYNAVFHFTEEDKHFANVLTVEEGQEIELALNVEYPSSFMSGTATTFTIKITNKGNMTAYAVPIYTYIRNSSKNSVSLIHYDGMNFGELLNNLSIDGLDSNDTEEIKNRILSLGDDVYFLKTWTKDDTTNDSIMVRTNYSFITIAPNSTKILNLVVKSNDLVDVWITTPNEWLSISEEEKSNSRHSKLKGNIVEDYYCCYKEYLECFMEDATKLLDGSSFALTIASLLTFEQPEISLALEAGALITGLGGCATSIANDSMKNFGDQLCNSKKDKILDRFLDAMKSKTPISLGSMVGCVGSVLSAWGFGAKAIFKAEESLIGNFGSVLGGGAFATDLSGSNSSCKKSREKKPNCPPNPNHDGGTSTPVNSHEPNAIIGYVAESGSRAIKEDLTNVFYTIQFENDTVFATAPAHDIYLTDTLDVNLFDLSTYRPTRITIGEKSMELTGERNFISTLDMRPEINAIAQIHGTIDDNTGIVRWHISSLDPMTMEPTSDPMVGVLPVNFDGSGLGEASYNISLKTGLPDGTIIHNRSGNIFDNNETVLTPTWENIVDAVAPTSSIGDLELENDTILRINVNGFDARSGVWKYELYIQHGQNAPWWKDGETDSTYFDFRFYEDIDYGFCVLATDSAGNVEKKLIQRERGFKAHEGDYEDSIIDVLETTSGTEDSYDISGRKVGRKAKGVIIRKSNDVSRKVLIK